MITADDKVGFLLNAFWKAQDAVSPASLFTMIQAGIRGQYQQGEKGMTVIATSGNGRSTQFLMPDFMKTFTPDDARRLFVQLYRVYNSAVAILATMTGFIAPTGPTDASQDQAIVNQMLAMPWAQDITESYLDMTSLRLFPESAHGGVSW